MKFVQLLLTFAAVLATAAANPDNACLVMTTAKTAGTGFILKGKNGVFLVSNQHVIDGPPPHRYELFDGNVLKPWRGWTLPNQDIVIFELRGEFPHHFFIEDDMSSVGLGEELVIYGNAEGQGMRFAEARLLRKSKTEIEVSGGIVHGCSGGPIVRKKNGKVVGVSTFVTIQPSIPTTIEGIVLKAAMPETRFYGVRIDAISDLVGFDLSTFVAQSAKLDSDKARFEFATTLVVLMAVKFRGESITEAQEYIKAATNEHLRILGLVQSSPWFTGRYTRESIVAFRAAADPLFAAPSKPTHYIHKDSYEALAKAQANLRELYLEVLKDIPAI